LCAQVVVPRKVIISDLHLGAGRSLAGKVNKLEDFRFDDEFSRFLSVFRDKPTQLVIAGDFIDFWQIMSERNVKQDRVVGSTVEDSRAKLRAAMDGHREVFKALGEFLSCCSENTIVIIPGNHDVDLSWREVQEDFRLAIPLNDRARLRFFLGGYRDHDVWVEHGHQYDTLNRFEHIQGPWKATDDGKRLEVNWGTEFVQRVFNNVEEKFEFIDNLVPTTDAIWLTLRRDPSLARQVPNLWQFIANAKRSRQALAALGREVYQEGGGTYQMANSPSSVLQTFKGEPDPFISYLHDVYDKDKNFRTELDNQFHSLSPEERKALAIPVVFKEKPDTKLSVVGTDPYIEAAELKKDNEHVKIVVFGHTHEAKTYPPDKPNPTYLNTGCWVQTLAVTKAKTLDWDQLKLDDHNIFPLKFSWVLVSYSQTGEPLAELKFWSPIKQ